MLTTRWNQIRDGLRSSDPRKLRHIVVQVGKIKTETIPDDVAHAVVTLFDHPEPEVRAEAVKAIGLHWRLPFATTAIAALVLPDEDWHVQLSAIDALGAIGRQHDQVRCLVSKVLANVVFSASFADNERMVAYVELLYVERKIGLREYLALDRDIPESLADFPIDRPWVEGLAHSDCAHG